MFSDPDSSWSDPEDTNASDAEGSPMIVSPWNGNGLARGLGLGCVLVGSLVREDGHVYSLATKPGGLLYTGSDSKNIRVWKGFKDFAGFKSGSGLVKAILIADDKIFIGHQDGKIRVWKVSSKDPSVHRRYGSLPTLKDVVKSSLNPNNYVLEAKKRRRFIWNKHSDAVSCLSLAEEHGLLYSSSWDRTFKVWRVSDSRCVESVAAHDDAVNSVAVGGDGVVFTGSADGTVKVWRREIDGEGTKHSLVKTLLKQDCAVTAVVVGPMGLYCGSSDGLVRFWKGLEYGGEVRGHEKAVLCMAARGRMVFSGSADKSICVWRREFGMVHVRVAVLSGHMGPVKCVAVEKEEEGWWRLYSGSLDKSVKVWRISES